MGVLFPKKIRVRCFEARINVDLLRGPDRSMIFGCDRRITTLFYEVRPRICHKVRQPADCRKDLTHNVPHAGGAAVTVSVKLVLAWLVKLIPSQVTRLFETLAATGTALINVYPGGN